ncbi:MAG: hypothetical protein CMJ87_04170 [Planctomycetes bacterium]|nr:hypothetical protein [Planctomycetota bacterium]
MRLAYCMNLHAARDLSGLLGGMRAVTLPLRERLAWTGPFGIGTYLPAELARDLVSGAGASDLACLRRFFVDEGLDPFTYNAFPAANFQSKGLKERVFEPTWDLPERLEYTLNVARIAAELARACGISEEGAHLSISTHCGRFGPWPQDGDQRRLAGEALATCAQGLRSIAAGGPRLLLALEPEPRSSAGDTTELAAFLGSLHGPGLADTLGTCLDTCHAAVEFEAGPAALAQATAYGPLAKLQFSSALALSEPGARPEARRLLLNMAEERFLHQVTARARDGTLLRVNDLPDLARELASDEKGGGSPAPWLDCAEWRCHFHVPVDLERVGELETTRRQADQLLATLLEDPDAWTTDELHLEIETYTWSVLEGAARGPGELVDGLEREYLHVMAGLRAAGWHTSDDAPGAA